MRTSRVVPRTAVRAARAVPSSLVSLILLLTLFSPSPATAAEVVCSGPQAIACENAKPGTPRVEWNVSGAGDPDLQGFTTDISVATGGIVQFKIDTQSPDYQMTIYRMGWYGGDGAREVATVAPSAPLPQQQPDCYTDATTGLVDCGNWGVSAAWQVPDTAVSGVYFAHLQRADTGGESHVVFVVRDDDSTSDMVFQTSDTTWQAYNRYGGYSLYVGSTSASDGRASKVSYNRPFTTADYKGEDWVFNAEFPMIGFLEANGYDVTYQAGIDTDRFGERLTNHRAFLSVGHDEYWSGPQRQAVERARDAGVDLGFFSGNEVYWKVRYERGIDGGTDPYRTMVSYKETRENAKVDPSPSWTGTWRDARFSPPSDGGRPENGLTGQLWTVQQGTYPIEVPAADGRMRFWRGTSVADLPAGGVAELAPNTLGYEWDEDVDNGARPDGLIRMSSTTHTVPYRILDEYGNQVGEGPATHALTLYRAPSGALVFGAGTVQWANGLGSANPSGEPDPRMQQATVNLFADMGIQPTTLIEGLQAATSSTDFTPPTATVTGPSSGTQVTNGQRVTVTGTATDVGGRVGGVEVSTDGGSSWHRAEGRETWSYSWAPSAIGDVSIVARATDDSANIGAPSSATMVSITCPCTIFGDAAPAVASTGDGGSVHLGVKFRATQDGSVTGIRYYRGPGNTGTHTGSLWSETGALLGSTVFTADDAEGWQTAPLPEPVGVSAGATYVVSYHAPNGGYALSPAYLNSQAGTAPVYAPSSVASGGNGVYTYSTATQAFPGEASDGANYWVDVVFSQEIAADVTPPGVVSRSPLPAATDVDPATAVAAGFNEPVQAGSIALSVTRDGTAQATAGSLSYDAASRTSTFTPSSFLTAGAAYTVRVEGARDGAGNVMAPVQWSFTTAGPRTCPCSIWDASATPATVAVSDSSDVELGVRFRVDTDGWVYGVRFYQGPGNGGTHTGSVWSSSGELLGRATFSGDSGSGWQEVTLEDPVPVQAGQTYVASYFAPQGRYAFTGGYFTTSGAGRSPLTAPAAGAVGGNGVFRYGSSGFPTETHNGGNYWVDVVYDTSAPAQDTSPPRVVSSTPAAGAPEVPVDDPVTARFSEPVDPATVQVVLTSGTGTQVSSTLSYNPASNTVTAQPDAPLSSGAPWTVRVEGARDGAGNVMAPVQWSFTTAGPRTCPCSIWDASATPATVAVSDSSDVELGVRFRVDTDGWVYGVRFYQGPGNGGTHTGSVWSSSGELLGRATFSGDSGSGWQEVTLEDPVPVQAGQTYVASYFAPQGRYAFTGGYFTTSGAGRSPLTAPAAGAVGGNGVFRYGSSGFPTETHNGGNYWVDVVYDTSAPAPDTAPPTVARSSPAGGATDARPADQVRVTFDEPVDPGTVALEVSLQATGGAVPGTVAYDADDRTAAFTPSTGLVPGGYAVRTSGARDVAGNVMVPDSRTFTVAAPQCPCGALNAGATPQTESSADRGPVEVGMRWRPAVDGSVSGIRFYQGPSNPGPHPASLWTADGRRLATVPLPDEPGTGWRTATLPAPVPVTAGQEYVVSYHAPAGGFAVTPGFFDQDVRSAALVAPASSPAAGNGVYRTGTSGFPESSGGGRNYWVDVVFGAGAVEDPAPVAVGLSPAASATDVATTAGISVTFDRDVETGSASVEVAGPAGPVAGDLRYDAGTRTLTFTPAQGLAAGAVHGVTVTGVTSPVGTPANAVSWSFTTGDPSCPCTVWAVGDVPQTPSVSERQSVELGTVVQPDRDGFLTGARFYRGAGNAGPHVGSLWSSDGGLLARAFFPVGGPDGWQEVRFGAPVAVTAGARYVVSYHAPQGGFAVTAGGLAQGAGTSPLRAPASSEIAGNGVYRYGSSAFPDQSGNGSSYWVDALFETAGTPDTAAPAVVAESPADGSTGVPVDVRPGGTVDEVVTGAPTVRLLGPGAVPVAATATWEEASRTFAVTPTATLATTTTYTVEVTGLVDLAGNAAPTFTWTFTTADLPCPCTVWGGDAIPQVASAGDGGPLELGVRIRADVDGWMSGVRFYKGAGNIGTHTGSLWSASGQLLARADFTDESATGWQQVDFATPVRVTAGDVVVASYFAPQGGYAYTQGALAQDVASTGLTALGTTGQAPNGLYVYGGSPGFPQGDGGGTSYWVDAVLVRTLP